MPFVPIKRSLQWAARNRIKAQSEVTLPISSKENPVASQTGESTPQAKTEKSRGRIWCFNIFCLWKLTPFSVAKTPKTTITPPVQKTKCNNKSRDRGSIWSFKFWFWKLTPFSVTKTPKTTKIPPTNSTNQKIFAVTKKVEKEFDASACSAFENSSLSVSKTSETTKQSSGLRFKG